MNQTIDTRERPWGAVASGLTFVVLSIAGIAVTGRPPNGHAAPADVVAFLQQYRSSVLAGMMLLSLANGALLLFFSQLPQALELDSRTTPLSRLSLVAAGLLCALGAATTALPAALTYYGPHTVSASTVALSRQVYFAANSFSAMPAALAVGAAGLSMMRSQTLPRWLSYLSLALAALELSATLSLAGSGSTGPDGDSTLTALFGSLTMWTLFVTLTIAVRTRAATTNPMSPS